MRQDLFIPSLMLIQKTLRLSKTLRFDREKFENAVENVRLAKKATQISQLRQKIGEQIKRASKEGTSQYISRFN